MPDPIYEILRKEDDLLSYGDDEYNDKDKYKFKYWVNVCIQV